MDSSSGKTEMIGLYDVPLTRKAEQKSMENVTKKGRVHITEHDGFSLCASHLTHIVLPVLYTFMFLTGLPGNILSLWIFIKKIPNKTSTHIYLVSLGVSNLLLCLTMPFQAAYLAWGTHWGTRQPACGIAIGGITPLLHINIYVGMFILTWIALSRCALLVQHDYGGRPSTCTRVLPAAFFHKLRQASFARVTCVATWIFVVSCVLPVVIYYSIHEAVQTGDVANQFCYSITVEVGGKGTQSSAIAAIMLFFLCFIVVMVSYISVGRHFFRYQRTRVISQKQRIYSRVFRKIVVIQLVLIVCLLPHHIFKAIFIDKVQRPGGPLTNGCHPMSQFVEIKNFLLCLAALRCNTDPIMYFLLDKTFRKNVLDVLKVRTSPQVTQTTGSNVADGPTSSQTTKALRISRKQN
ncbi:putative G-protein coupled receptor 82 [Arapaima gigas]